MSKSRQELAYSQIRQRVLGGFYGPGYRLVISNLALDFGISPSPIREALRRLEAEGLVRYTHNSGAIVTPVSQDAYVETLAVMGLLEGHAARLAAPHIDAAAISEMRRINDGMRAALEAVDPQQFGRLNRAFHCRMYDFCPNRYVVECLEQAWNRLDAVRRTSLVLLPGRGPSSIREHAAMIDAIESGQAPTNIEELVRQHKQQTIETFRLWQATLEQPRCVLAV